MPYVINGFGTWNYGRANTISIAAFCEHCGAFGNLSSYDTRTFVTALFVPIIPLAKRRILNHCPACDKWTEMRLGPWAALCADVHAKAQDVMQNTLADPDAAIDALQGVMAIQDRPTFDHIAARIAQAHGGNARVLRELGAGYVGFGVTDTAEKCYRASLKAEDSVEAHEGLAYACLLQNRATEAAPHLRHLLTQSDPQKAFLLALLAQGLQAEGKHDEAIAVIETAMARNLALQQDKAWKKLLKTAQKHRGSTVPLRRAALTAKGKPVKDSSPLKPILAGIALVVIVASVYVSLAIVEAQSRTIHLVNGLNRSYEVTIDGEPHLLQANEAIGVTVGEGQHTIHAKALGLPEETIDIHTGFFARPFREELFAINPDRVAVLIWEKTEYSDDTEEEGNYEYAVHTNEVMHYFPNVDHMFEEFPDEIFTKANREMRTRVGSVPVEPETVIQILYEELDEPALVEHLKRRFHYSPNNTVYIQNLVGFLGPEDFLAEVVSELESRPIKIEVHRHYQQLQEAIHPEHDLEVEYGQLLAADPDADMVYLAGRVTRDPDKANELMTKAAEGSSAYAWGALAYAALANGEYEDAMPKIDQALQLAPDNANFQQTRGLLRLATKDYDRYLDTLPKDAAGFPEDFSTLQAVVHVMGVRGDSAESVNQYIRNTMAHYESMDGPIPSEDRETAETYLMTAHACGYQAESCAEASEKSEGPQDKIISKLLRGEVQAAADEAKNVEVDGATHACIYLLATEQGLGETAETHLTKYVTALQESGDRQSREMADVLSGAQPGSADRLIRLTQQPDLKRVALAVLAAKFPEDRQRYLALARTLNFERSHPCFILDAYLTRAGF